MTPEELKPYQDQASYSEINQLGSNEKSVQGLLYTAVTTRPDIAFVASRYHVSLPTLVLNAMLLPIECRHTRNGIGLQLGRVNCQAGRLSYNDSV
jgi:hypothetical protein